MSEARGVLVRGVMPGEPADRGGVIEVTIGLYTRDLQRVVSSTPVGKRVRVMLLRGDSSCVPSTATITSSA
jgi:S1-C subfamily serine protease